MPARQELPSTLRRSSAKARRTWTKAHDSAVRNYGEGQRAHRTAYSALKHKFEKVGDRWKEKDDQAPSDKQAAGGVNESRHGKGAKTAGGVDVNASKNHLYDVTQELGIEGRPSMNKSELVEAIEKAHRRQTAQATTRRNSGAVASHV